MSRLISAISISLLLACSAIAQKKSDIDHDLLVGSVKSVRIESAKLVNRSSHWVEKRRNLDRVINYDPEGFRTKETIYLDRPTITHVTYRYDKDGNRSEEIMVEGTLGPSSSYRVYGTDSGGSKGDGEDRSIRLVRRIFKHDSDGNRVEEITSSNIGSATIRGRANSGTYSNVYDTKGRRKETTYMESGFVKNKWVFDNDENGNVREMSKFSEGGHLLLREWYEYEFDKNGNWIKRTTSKWKKRGSKSYFEPEEVAYRSIDYY